jgi:hypothetical protein
MSTDTRTQEQIIADQRVNIVKLAHALGMKGGGFFVGDVVNKAIERIRAGERLAQSVTMANEEFKLK